MHEDGNEKSNEIRRTVRCRKCGSKISKDDIYCHNCGEVNRYRYLRNNPKYIIPFIFTALFILYILNGLFTTHVIYSDRYWARTSGSGTAGNAWPFDARIGQIITLSYHIHETTTLPTAYVYVAYEKDYFDRPHSVIAFYGDESGQAQGTIPSNGRYYLVVKEYGSGYISMDLELRINNVSFFEFMSTLFIAFLFLHQYWNKYLQ